MKNQSKQPYDYPNCVKLHDFVRSMGYRKTLNNTALHIYFAGMPELERMKTGLCQPTSATYKDIAEYSNISIPGIKDALIQLNGSLCEIDIGQSLKAEKLATRFRRYTIQDLKNGKSYQKLKNERPQPALDLQKILTDRPFIYGNTSIKPSWSVGQTGRLYSRSPQVQGDSKNTRQQNICRGLLQGEVLFDLDYKRAEPTVVQHATSFSFASDPYDLLSDIRHITRDEAKTELNKLNYSPIDPVKIIEQWSPVDQAKFMPYAEAIHQLREKLWTDGAPQGKGKLHFVKTLCGSIIEAERGKPPHRGQILSWYAQGTIADILNSVCLEVIKAEPHKGWRFVFPMHDAAYIIGKPEHESELKEIFLKMPQKFGINLEVDVKKYQ